MSLVDVNGQSLSFFCERAGLKDEAVLRELSDGTLRGPVEVSRRERSVDIRFQVQQRLPLNAYMRVQEAFQAYFGETARRVTLRLEYESEETDVLARVREYWVHAVELVLGEDQSLKSELKDADKLFFDERFLRVPVTSDVIVNRGRQKSYDEKLALWFREHLSLNFHVQLFADEVKRTEVSENLRSLIVEQDRAEGQKAAAAEEEKRQEAARGGNGKGEGPAPEKVEIGHCPIDDEVVRLKSVQDEMRRVTVEGRIFTVDTRELASGRTLFTFNITDNTDSISCKVFAKGDKQLEVLKLLKDGLQLRVRGTVQFDTFAKELVLMIQDMHEVPKPMRRDTTEQKRVELHAHTPMSSLDGIVPVKDLIGQAAKWGHKAVAITDHGVVQAFPEAYSIAQKNNIKALLGLEAYVVDDGALIVYQLPDGSTIPIDGETEWVVFDTETTGLNAAENTLIEIAAVKMKGREIVGEWTELIDPEVEISAKITELTHITNDMVKGKRKMTEVLEDFRAFVGDAILVAHNAEFDLGFLKACSKRTGLEPWKNVVLDTLSLARRLYPRERSYRLGTLAKKFDVELINAHRALDDTVALAKVYQHMLRDMAEKGFDTLEKLNQNDGEIDYASTRPFHVTILVQNKTGLRNLYKLVSESHIKYFHRVPRVPRSLITKFREGLIVGTACQQGELFDSILRGKTKEELKAVAEFYDYLEIQPLQHYKPLLRMESISTLDTVKDYHRMILDIGQELGKPVVATGDVHYLNPEDAIYRQVFLQAQNDRDANDQPPLHFMSTDEMLEAFSYLGPELAHEVVVTNTNKIADMIEDVCPIPDKLYTPKMDEAPDEITEMCYKRAKSLYGEKLPEIVEARLEKELNSIIKHGFAGIYMISQKIVRKSLDDGYLVGSRGSVGSSFVATMTEITEVNPLPPHYRCPSCKWSEFLGGTVGSGFDLPDKNCPECGTELAKDGHDIPFETFLGFKGDKVPDIDLNFSGDYQARAHAYTKVLFGDDYVYRAGTIATVAEKTAFGYVKKFAEEKGWTLRSAEMNSLVTGCTGIKRTTGQHPGGILVVPNYMDVYDFCPIQFPADDKNAEWKTSHFDFHAIHDNLLKLDILGHDDPTVIRMLQDLTGLDPKQIPTDDPKVMSLFGGTEALTIDPDNPVTPDKIRSKTGTYGIPEFGTKFVRQMLEATKPTTFSELLQISGLSHGTDVWLGNAQKLIDDGICKLKDVIGCRDDIMVYLIYAGLEPSFAFKIMESVRKGKGLTPEMEEEMKKNNVPDWYIWSCKQIKYMFPKAHATAYVMMAVRIAYFKVHFPLEFYATYFSVRADDFDLEIMGKGYDAIKAKIQEIEDKGFQAAPKEKALHTVLEMALEMTARGYKFLPLDLYKSDATRFQVVKEANGLLPPFGALAGCGESAAKAIADSAKQGEFLSIQDLQERSRVSKTVIELLESHGCLKGMPESNQLSLF